jgi:hypothetical protein
VISDGSDIEGTSETSTDGKSSHLIKTTIKPLFIQYKKWNFGHHKSSHETNGSPGWHLPIPETS